MLQYAGQAIVYAAVAAFIGYFASRPLYQQFPDGQAQIKLSFAHGAARTRECRRLTPQEIAKLPPNQRRPNTCDRARVDMHVQLDLDGEVIYDARLPPTGLAGDGPARVYKKFVVPAGPHTLIARLRDTREATGFNYETRRDVELAPGQNLAVDFKADAGGFIFQ
ncbi:MAG: hypothetical protein MPJ78_14035 [Hyphomicrobiaceae bacterium]|nr:hypothetical protein [Hyphomicrobiaceae bacterium]